MDELSKLMAELQEPMLSDLSLLPRLHKAYVRVYDRRGCPERALTVDCRKKFLFVVLCLYSPRAFAGIRMRRGLRRSLSALFGLTASTPISDNRIDLMLQYQAYPDFRRDVDSIFREIYSSLTEIMDVSTLCQNKTVVISAPHAGHGIDALLRTTL